MFLIITILLIVLAWYLFKKLISNDKYTVNEYEFRQAGVLVTFATGKITIKGKTYNATDVQGIETLHISKLAAQISIKVDDFNTPIHKIHIRGVGKGAAEKFVQRLSTALRKAGGPSFY